jgi:peptidoglycan/xylan/chitin deacetylase (PgdA/CDA1 family)
MTVSKSTQVKIKAASLISDTIGGISKSHCPHTLMYHSVSASLNDSFNDIYSISLKHFKEQMSYLTSNNKHIIPFSCFSSDGNAISLTFDDGYQDTLDIVAPILQENNMPFTVFVTPEFVKSNNRQYLNKNTLKQLSQYNNCHIGAHGFSHVRLTECSQKKLYSELIKSKIWLEDLLQKPVETMSYPHGAVNQYVRDAAEDAGYKVAASSRPGGNCSDIADKLCMNRTDIWSTDCINTFSSKVEGRWDWTRFFIK